MHRYLAYVQTGQQVVGFYDTEPLTFKKRLKCPYLLQYRFPVSSGAKGDSHQEMKTMYSRTKRHVEGQPMKEIDRPNDEIHLDFERPWSPAMDVRLCEGEFIVYADLPGVSEDSVRVVERNGSLYILGERAFEHEDHCEEFLQVERFYGAFEGRISLPARADSSRMEMDYRDGVLKLTVPLSKE
jgi:HSP20 family molecular chaperone IbpA